RGHRRAAAYTTTTSRCSPWTACSTSIPAPTATPCSRRCAATCWPGPAWWGRTRPLGRTAPDAGPRSEDRQLLVGQDAAVLLPQPHLAREVRDDVAAEVDAGELLGHVDPAGRVDVHFHQLVADDVQAGEVHAVADQLGRDDLGKAERGGIGFGQLGLAPGADVAARVAAVVVAPEAGVVAVHPQRAAVEGQQAQVAVGGLGQVFLGDGIAVADHRFDHLVEVGALV